MTSRGESYMTEPSRRVRIILDPDFGERLALLPPGEPAWVVESQLNTPAAERLWRERPAESHLSGVTTFRPGRQPPEDGFIDLFPTVDLHHGRHSTDRPYDGVQVHGVPLSPAVRAALAEFGFTEFRPTADGFVATRAVGS